MSNDMDSVKSFIKVSSLHVAVIALVISENISYSYGASDCPRYDMIIKCKRKEDLLYPKFLSIASNNPFFAPISKLKLHMLLYLHMVAS